MKFSTVGIVKHTVDAVWNTMRDDLPRVTSQHEDIYGVREQDRHVSSSKHTIVNIWTANTKLPAALVSIVGADRFVWTDRAEWHNKNKVCTWSIEPHQFSDSIHCRGTTVFTPALGGTGTKITFSGDLEWETGKLPSIATGISQAVLSGAEGIIRNVIQRNFRRIFEAVGAHLDSLGHTD